MAGTKNPDEGPSPSELIDGRIAELDDWRGELLGAAPRARQGG